MDRKVVLLFCIVVALAAAAQSAPQTNAQISESHRAQKKISAYADAQCKGKDGDAATKCRLETLWAATQCDPDVLERQARMPAVAGTLCLVSTGGFAFDVVSIKPHENAAGERRTPASVGPSLDGYHSLNTPINYLILNAYNLVQQSDITAGPDWLKEDRYDFEAKYSPEVTDAIRKLGSDDYGFVLRYLLRQVLKERMNFAAQTETKDVPAYDLVIGKNGPKLKEADLTAPDVGDTVTRPDPAKRGMLLVITKGMSMTYLSHIISGSAGRPVFDKTGLTGFYSFTLEYPIQQTLSAAAPQGTDTSAGLIAAPDPSGGAPTIMDAISTLGLKLVPSRGPMTVVVIEHIDKPDVN